MFGIPATAERKQKLILATVSKLPELRRQLKKLQATVDGLQEQLAEKSQADSTQQTQSTDHRAVA